MTGLCVVCSAKQNLATPKRKAKRPNAKKLKKQVEQMGRQAVGRFYGVTGASIAKWLIAYGLPRNLKRISRKERLARMKQ